MYGLKVFDHLSQEIKNKIIAEYGSLKELYAHLISLEQQFYISGGKNNMIRNAVYDIADKLEEFGLADGTDITTLVEQDFNEIATLGDVEKLEQHLRNNGIR